MGIVGLSHPSPQGLVWGLMSVTRKIIVAPKPVSEVTEGVVSLQTIMNNSLIVLQNEVSKLLNKSTTGQTLSKDDIKNLCAFLRLLLDAGKLQLEQRRAEDLSHLDEIQLVEMSKKALKEIMKGT